MFFTFPLARVPLATMNDYQQHTVDSSVGLLVLAAGFHVSELRQAYPEYSLFMGFLQQSYKVVEGVGHGQADQARFWCEPHDQVEEKVAEGAQPSSENTGGRLHCLFARRPYDVLLLPKDCEQCRDSLDSSLVQIAFHSN